MNVLAGHSDVGKGLESVITKGAGLQTDKSERLCSLIYIEEKVLHQHVA